MGLTRKGCPTIASATLALSEVRLRPMPVCTPNVSQSHASPPCKYCPPQHDCRRTDILHRADQSRDHTGIGRPYSIAEIDNRRDVPNSAQRAKVSDTAPRAVAVGTAPHNCIRTSQRVPRRPVRRQLKDMLIAHCIAQLLGQIGARSSLKALTRVW